MDTNAWHPDEIHRRMGEGGRGGSSSQSLKKMDVNRGGREVWCWLSTALFNYCSPGPKALMEDLAAGPDKQHGAFATRKKKQNKTKHKNLWSDLLPGRVHWVWRQTANIGDDSRDPAEDKSAQVYESAEGVRLWSGTFQNVYRNMKVNSFTAG